MDHYRKFLKEQQSSAAIRNGLGATLEQLYLPGLEPSPAAVPVADCDTADALIQAVQEINRHFATCLVGSKYAVLYEHRSPINGQVEVIFLSPATFKYIHCDRSVYVNGKQIELGKAWLKHPGRRHYDSVVFAPEGAPRGHYNLWQGFTVQPRQGSKCARYLRHGHDNICGGERKLFKFVMSFMADAVQNPASKPGVALVLRGEQGVGKGVFVNHFGSLFGPHFAHVNSLRHLTGNFNSVLMNKLLVFADEAVWIDNKPAEGILKALVTEKTLYIEPKGVDAFQLANYIRLIVASNNDRVVPAGPSERRFCVIDVQSNRKQDHAYFAAIDEDMKNGGREALMHFLLHWPLQGVNLRAFPQTAALDEQKIRNMDPVVAFWLDVLIRGYVKSPSAIWELPLSADDLQTAFSTHAGRAASKSRQTTLGIKLNKLVPDLRKSRVSQPGLGRIYTYTFPALAECRNHFDKIMSLSTEWSD